MGSSMRCVAEHRDPALGPAREGLAVAHAHLSRPLRPVRQETECPLSRNEATQPLLHRGLPGWAGWSLKEGGRVAGLIAKLSSESIGRRRVMQWPSPDAAAAERCAMGVCVAWSPLGRVRFTLAKTRDDP